MARAENGSGVPVGLLVVESDRMSCQLLQSAFRGGRRKVAVVGATVDSAEAVKILKAHDPDVAIVSSRLLSGLLAGYDLVREIHRLGVPTRIVMLLESRERDPVIDAFRFGAHGVVFRDEPVSTLAKCIHAVHSGQIWASSLYMGYVVEALGKAMPLAVQDFSSADRLTPREKETTELVAEGISNREISARLGLSEHTVRNYVQHVFEKLGLSTRAELMLYWIHRRNHHAQGKNGDLPFEPAGNENRNDRNDGSGRSRAAGR
jgi:DNA-binding NarL/FixJ family response regulator